MFTNQTNRRLLQLVSLTFVLASGLLVWQAFQLPTTPSGTGSQSPTTSIGDASETMTRRFEDFGVLLTRSLRSPLYDPPADPQPPALESEEPPDVADRELPELLDPDPEEMGLRLVGTMIESEQSTAILADAEGNIILRKVGDTVVTAAGDGQIQRVELNLVTIQLEDVTHSLSVP